MYRSLYRFLIFSCLVSLSENILGQTYPFINYTVESGLSQAQVLCAFQDDEGVMWFGTSGGGITKYDGHFYEYITDKDGLADNVVYCIVKDKKGRLLIGTNNGLSIYHPKLKSDKKKFKNLTTNNGLSHNRIFTIFLDEKDKILLGTGQGISELKDTVCSTLKIDEVLNTSSVFHLFKDSHNQLWCSTLGSGVFKYDGKSIENFTNKKNGLGNDMVFAVLEKSKDVYWFFTGEGLFEFNGQKITQINITGIENNTTYYSYFKTKDNVLWVATGQGALKIEANNPIKILNAKSGLVNNSIWKIIQDKESNIWLTSDQNGVSKLANERFFIYTSKDGLVSNEIRRIYQNKHGDYLIGSKLGLSIFNKDGNIKNFTTTDFGNGNAGIWSINEDNKEGYLIGTGNGLLLFDGNKFKRITCKDEASPLNAIYDIHIDEKGDIWLGTQAGVAQVKEGYIKAFETPITKGIVDEIYQDTKGNFWFGTDDGLYQYNGKTVKHFTKTDGFTEKRVNTILNDRDGNLWIATFAGIYKYENGKFNHITEKNGLSSNEVLSLGIDKNNTIWAGLSTGIDRIEEKNGAYKIKHYGIEDGFIGKSCNLNGITIDNNGNVLIGTSEGLIVYQAKYDADNLNEPLTKFKSIDLFFQKTDWKTYADSVSQNNIPYNLELPFDKNYLTFNFIGVSLTTPTKVSYQFMLKGIDKDWRLSEKTDVSYSNIPPGNYEFLVKANNGEGIWNKEPISFKFKIRPPFWNTWWFYTIIALIVLIWIYSYFKIRTSNIKITQQHEIIAEKNNALSYANLEIAEKNQNITDSINYAKRIQQSFLTSDSILSKVLKNYFILYKPRNIVSGDFYLAFDFPDRTIIICSDCTGHGIPGAFMSLISISMLNEIFRSKELLEPAKILDELRRKIIQALNPELSEEGGKDGMDISIISIFKNLQSDEIKIHFAGANSSFHMVTNDHESPKMIELKGNNQPVGFFSKMVPFTNHEIIGNRGDIIYLYTDGYADQFGGINGKKFMSKQLKQILVATSKLSMKDQEVFLDNKYKDWQGNLEQVDDVTVIGIKL